MIDLHNPHPYGSLTCLGHQPHCSVPYFATITNFHKASSSEPNLHNQDDNNALFITCSLLRPKPPCSIGEQTCNQLTKWYFFTLSFDPQRNCLSLISIALITLRGITIKDI
ncbi:hypothetical protein FRX31_009085 [Thalictrum thalictroides]|uniref:Uncharacterized protein n=1 Tax=Thalictrum thalictroides TaxID=46969 RepID=A0A7J6WXX1_THATH|nr:hypothetical protein FRX31_009085 [Thalictrum thalictroides]